MADETKEFWDKMRGKLRRALDLDPLCQEESEKEYKKAKPKRQLSDDEINAIMQFATSFGEDGGMVVEPEPSATDEDDQAASEWVDPVKAEDMDAELMELVNRNRGEQDDETTKLLDKYREQALGDAEPPSSSEEEADHGQDPT